MTTATTLTDDTHDPADEVGASLEGHLAQQEPKDWPPEIRRNGMPVYASDYWTTWHKVPLTAEDPILAEEVPELVCESTERLHLTGAPRSMCRGCGMSPEEYARTVAEYDAQDAERAQREAARVEPPKGRRSRKQAESQALPTSNPPGVLTRERDELVDLCQARADILQQLGDLDRKILMVIAERKAEASKRLTELVALEAELGVA